MAYFLRKYFNYIITGSFSIVFAACYGTKMGLENPKLIKVMDDNQNAIPGLKVTLFENKDQVNQQFTDEKGSVEFNISQKENYLYKAVIEDIDGSDNNGNFSSREIDLTNQSFVELNLERID